jgi:hypothetical protein
MRSRLAGKLQEFLFDLKRVKRNKHFRLENCFVVQIGEAILFMNCGFRQFKPQSNLS